MSIRDTLRETPSWSGESSRLRRALITAGQWIDAQGWCPATGGNFSARLTTRTDEQQTGSCCVVTASGFHKGRLQEEHFLEVDLQGQPLCSGLQVRPSAETLVHVALYRLDPEIGAVLHAHSIPNTVLSLIERSERLTIQGFEMQKSLRGQMTHTDPLFLEVFENTQDMSELAQWVTERWSARGGLSWGLLVRGHGVYIWGRDVDEARRHLDGTEFLLSCLLELKKLNIASQ